MVDLSHGATHFQGSGPIDGKPILLIHGVASWSFAWDPLIPSLEAAGRRIIRLDLYGRGFSARPKIDHTVDLYVDQALELLDALEVERPVDVVGWSMGGAVAVALTDKAPQRVDRLALMAPAGLQAGSQIAAMVLKIPAVGEVMSSLFVRAAMRRGVAQNFTNFARAPEFLAGMLRSLESPGYSRSVLSCLRNFPFRALSPTYARVGRQERRICLLWGTRDRLVPFSAHKQALALLPNAEFVRLEGLDHACHWEDVDLVAKALTRFLA